MRYGVLVGATALYWYWESFAEGNIRIDLLVLYPALTAIYLAILWPTLRWKGVALSAVLMIVNFGFFLISYDLFDKHPG